MITKVIKKMNNLKIKLPIIQGEYCKVIQYIPLGIYDHELDDPPYEVLFTGTLSDCYAYIKARQENLLDDY